VGAAAVAGAQLDDEVVDPPRPLPWYPNKLAWHMNFSRGQLRKLSWLEEIHEFMKAANDAGSITRQEAVSMVPPLFMDVQPNHKVRQWLPAGPATAV
jgi:16S rRNA C967 or C1407 C5-methylase (RsmB/RsmF family)